MKRHQHADFQKITSTILKRVGKIGQQNLLDLILPRLVFPDGTSVPLASGSAAYFPTSGRVTYLSGDRSTGATVSIAAGVGIKRKASDPDDDVPLFEPIVLTAASSQVLSASDPTNDRIDRIFMRPKLVSENSQSVDVIDTSEVVSSSSEDQDERYDFEKVVATGTPSGSPALPSIPGGWDAADEIAQVLVQSGSGTIDASDITDKRTEFRIATDLSKPAASQVTVAMPLTDDHVQDALERIEALANGNGLLTFWDDTPSVTNVPLSSTVTPFEDTTGIAIPAGKTYQIKAQAQISIRPPAGNGLEGVEVRLLEKKDAGAWVERASGHAKFDQVGGGGESGCAVTIPVQFRQKTVTAGSTYKYKVEVENTSTALALTINGSMAGTQGSSSLDVEAQRV